MQCCTYRSSCAGKKVGVVMQRSSGGNPTPLYTDARVKDRFSATMCSDAFSLRYVGA